MKRLSLILLFLLLVGTPTLAQTTANLSVTDTPDNQTWSNGTWTVQLVNAGNPGQSSAFTLLSGGGSVANQSGTLSGTGTASMSLPANVNIGPGGTKWQFVVCPQASAGCFISNVTIGTSSPQTVALTPPSIRINLTTATPPVSLYATGEVTQAVLGSQFFLIGTGQQFCTAVTGTTCNTWGGSGLTSVSCGNPAGAINGSNVTFTLPSAPAIPANLLLYHNGILQLNPTDYTISSATITEVVAPLTGESLSYCYPTNSLAWTANAGTPGGSINGANKTFTLPTAPLSPANLQLYQNGVLQFQNVDYTIAGLTITYVVAPLSGGSLAYAAYN